MADLTSLQLPFIDPILPGAVEVASSSSSSSSQASVRSAAICPYYSKPKSTSNGQISYIVSTMQGWNFRDHLSIAVELINIFSGEFSSSKTQFAEFLEYGLRRLVEIIERNKNLTDKEHSSFLEYLRKFLFNWNEINGYLHGIMICKKMPSA